MSDKVAQVAGEYLASLRQRNAEGDGVSDEKLRRCERLIRLHLSQDKIWDMQLRHIKPGHIEEYISRRIQKGGGRKARRVTNNTLNVENTHLRAIFRHAVDMGYIPSAPKVPIKGVKWENLNARRTFTSEEWETLTAYMRKWVEAAPEGRAYATSYREIMRDFVLLMGYSGLRPNEARYLKWKDITIEQGEPTDAYPDGDHSVFIRVENPKHNTNKREAVALPWAKTVCDRRMRLSEFTSPDDYVFCHPNCSIFGKPGSPIQSCDRLFAKVLKGCGLRKRGERHPLTLYSLRHFYITARLTESNIDAYRLARIVGNSVEVIKDHYDKSKTRSFKEQAIAMKSTRKQSADVKEDEISALKEKVAALEATLREVNAKP